MELRNLGTSGRRVTRLGLGMAALGRPGYITLGHADDLNRSYMVETMERHAHAVLDTAWAAGMRYFDAARSYGRGEEFLGNWLRDRDIDPAAVTVGSKWGYTYTADWQVNADVHEVKEHSLDVLRRQWGETTANLGGYLDLYQVHSATLDSGVLENADVLNELARLKRNGTAIGLSLSGADQAATLRRAVEIELDGARLFDAVQVTWNLLEPSTGPLLAEVHTAGMGVIIKEILANARLTPRNDHPDFARQRALLGREAARLDTTMVGLAVAAGLAQPWADVVLSGAATAKQVESNVAGLSVAWDEAAANALTELAEPPDQYWQTRKNLAWN